MKPAEVEHAVEDRVDADLAHVDLPARPGEPVRRRGFWALTDQAVVSGGNFVTNIVLANAMAANEYGRFSLLWGILLLLNSLHGGLVTYPLSVRGGAGGPPLVRLLAGGAMGMTLLLSVATIGASTLAAGVLGVPEVAPWMAFAGLAWQLQETMRRAQLAAFRLRAATIGDLVSYFGQAVAVVILGSLGKEHLIPVFACMGVTSLLAAGVQAWDLRVRWPGMSAVRKQLRSSWTLGRWVLLSSLVGVINLQAIPWVVTAFHGPDDAAALAAVANVLGLTNPIVLGLGAVITPSVAQARARQGVRAGVMVGLKFAILGAALLLPVWVTIGFAPDWVLSVFYRSPDSPYRGLAMALQIMLVIYMIHFGAAMMGIILGGLEKSGQAFICSLAAVAGTLLLTMPASAKYSYIGALAASCASELLRLICTLAFVGMMLRRAAAERGESGSQAAGPTGSDS